MIGVTTRRGGRAASERLAICSSAIIARMAQTRKRDSRACDRIFRRRLRRRRRRKRDPARAHTLEEADPDADSVRRALAVAFPDAETFAASVAVAERLADAEPEPVA